MLSKGSFRSPTQDSFTKGTLRECKELQQGDFLGVEKGNRRSKTEADAKTRRSQTGGKTLYKLSHIRLAHSLSLRAALELK